MNAIFNLPNVLKIALLLITAISLWLIFDERSPTAPTLPDTPEQRSSDYSMTDFVMHVMDEQGRLSRIIKGSQASHYPDDDSSEILIPEVLVIGHEHDDWLIEADRADTQGKGEHIVLTGNVIITNQNEPEVQLLTELLNLDTVHNTAYTDQPALMKAPQGDTHSVGLHADLQERTINLHSRVRGQYDAPATH